MRMLRAIRRETEIYDRNRESLYELRYAAVRARVHALMAQITLALQGVLDAHGLIDLAEDAARGFGPADPIRGKSTMRVTRLAGDRQAAFDFMMELRSQIAPVTKVLSGLAKQPFSDHAPIVRAS